MNEIQNKLPADPGAMILGIIALIISLIGCCCGILAIPAVIMSIIGLIWANKSMTTYAQTPDTYSLSSFSNVKSARVINIIALVLSGIALIISLIFFGTLISDPENIFRQIESGEFNTEEYEDNTTTEDVDTWEYEENTQSDESSMELEETTDSL